MEARNLFLALGLAMFCQILFGQTVYGDLPVKRFYDASLSKSGKGDKTIYKVNDDVVDKETYEKYSSAWENFETCCPCILQTYDINDVLLTEAVSCTDCLVGFYFEFHENGVTKLKGQYKENPTGDWKNIFDRGYCSVKDGLWEYYDEEGKPTHTETWKDGDFVQQVPKGDRPEIWRIDMLANNQKIVGNQLEIASLNTFEIIPHYKNDHKNKRLQAVISATSATNRNKQVEAPILAVNAEKLKHLVGGLGAKTGERIRLDITIYDDEDEKVQTLYLSAIAK